MAYWGHPANGHTMSVACMCCRDIAEGQQPVFEFPFAIEGDKVSDGMPHTAQLLHGAALVGSAVPVGTCVSADACMLGHSCLWLNASNG